MTGAGSHVAIAERGGRVVKERCRSIISALPYQLPARLTRYLVLFVVTRLNLIPRAADGSTLSPRERFTGQKMIYKRDLEIGFGDYAEAWAKPKQKNSMEPRTISGIALCPVGNDEGSWYFYNLVEGSVFQRSQWKVLPIPEMVIRIMNELARKDGLSKERGGQVPVSRDVPMVGEIPAGRMIVNPSLDVPRYGPDGTRLDVTIHRRRNNRKVTIAKEAESVQAPVETDIPPAECDGETAAESVVEEDVDAVPIGGEDNEPAGQIGPITEENNTQIGPITEESETQIGPIIEEIETPEKDLGHRFEDGVRKSVRLAQRRDEEMRVLKMTVKESVTRLGDKAHDAFRKEFGNMVALDVFEPIRFEDLTEDQRQRIIHSSAFLTEKTDENGEVIGHKARWVGSGNEMRRDLYESGSSPTIAVEAIFILISLCAGGQMIWCTMDIGSDYLN